MLANPWTRRAALLVAVIASVMWGTYLHRILVGDFHLGWIVLTKFDPPQVTFGMAETLALYACLYMLVETATLAFVRSRMWALTNALSSMYPLGEVVVAWAAYFRIGTSEPFDPSKLQWAAMKIGFLAELIDISLIAIALALLSRYFQGTFDQQH